MQDLSQGIVARTGFSLRNGLLFYKHWLVVPHSSSFILIIISEFHSSPIGGHFGEIKTYQRIASKLCWVGMRSDIAKFVPECETCQRNKSLTTTPVGLLQPLPLPLHVWNETTMDFIEGLLRVEGCSTILIVVDLLSKYAHFMNLKHPYSAKTVETVFVKEIVRLHDIPSSIITDRDKIFLSHFWKEIFWQRTILKNSIAYHLQTDGQSEVVNHCLKAYLRCFSSDKPQQWNKWLS